MEIREGSNRITIEHVDYVPGNLPWAGSLELSLEVISERFAGHGFAWIDVSAMESFLTQLGDLDEKRQGLARIEGVVPDEFHLRFWSVDRWGHLAVGGRISKHVHEVARSPYFHVLEFAFDFDPSLLPRILAEFRVIARSRRR